jgi:hypothetical protein
MKQRNNAIGGIFLAALTLCLFSCTNQINGKSFLTGPHAGADGNKTPTPKTEQKKQILSPRIRKDARRLFRRFRVQGLHKPVSRPFRKFKVQGLQNRHSSMMRRQRKKSCSSG